MVEVVAIPAALLTRLARVHSPRVVVVVVVVVVGVFSRRRRRSISSGRSS